VEHPNATAAEPLMLVLQELLSPILLLTWQNAQLQQWQEMRLPITLLQGQGWRSL